MKRRIELKLSFSVTAHDVHTHPCFLEISLQRFVKLKLKISIAQWKYIFIKALR